MKALLTICSFTALTAFGQSEPIASMFWNVNEYYNPATTGMDYRHKAIVQHRNVYGFKSTIGSYGMKSEKLRGGIGVNGIYQSAGTYSSTAKINANYSYHLKLGESTLGIGAQGGIYNIATSEINYFVAPNQTTTIPAGNTTNFNASTGLYYKRRKLSLGVSATQLIRNKAAHYDLKTNYWFTAAYDFKVSENFQLTPTLLVSVEGQFHTVAANLRATIYNKLWLGASARNRDSYAFMAGYDFAGKFRVGYAYETTVSRLNNGVGQGTHEAVLGFLLK